MAKVLNPFSVRLKSENPFYELSGKPCFVHPLYNWYTIWKYGEKHFVSCCQNIVINETVGCCKEVISDFAEGKVPQDSVKRYFNHERIAEAIEDGKKFAKQLGFEIKPLL